MKYLSLLLVTVILFACNNEDEVPPSVKDGFTSKYPTAENIDWDKKNDMYEVEFDMNDEEYEAIYSTTGGVWLETTKDIEREALPAEVDQVLNSEMYSSWEIDEIEEAETSENPRLYKIRVKMGDKKEYHYYDPQGNLVKKS